MNGYDTTDIEWFNEATKGHNKLSIYIILFLVYIFSAGVILSIYLINQSQYFLFIIELIFYIISPLILFIYFFLNIPKKIGMSRDYVYFVYPKKSIEIKLSDINNVQIKSKKDINHITLKINLNLIKKLRLNEINTNKLMKKIKLTNQSVNIKRA